MKKWLRLLTGVLACLLCMSLTGCEALTEARNNHAVWQEDGSIRLGDVKYKELPASEQLSPMWDYSRTINITAADVPVLLADQFGDRYDISEDGVFIGVFEYRDAGNVIYCREDKYDEIAARINAGFEPAGYCYMYEYWDEETYAYYTRFYALNDMQIQAVDTVYATVEPEIRDDMDWDYVTLEACSADMLFREEIGELRKIGEKYVLTKQAYDQEDGEWITSCYLVPSEMNSLFASIMAKQLEAEASWGDPYGDEYL